MRPALLSLLLASGLFAQEQWVNRKVMPSETAKLTDGNVEIPWDKTSLPLVVYEVQGNLLRVGRGFVDKADVVLLEEAADYYTAFLRRHPNSPNTVWAYSCRAIVWDEKRELDKAINDYTEAIRLEPKDPSLYLRRGQDWMQKGDLDSALQDFREAVRLDPTSAAAYNERGNVQLRKGNLDAAIKDYTEAIHLDPKEEGGYYNRAIAWQLKGDLEAALKDNNEAIHLAPRFPAPYNNRGNVWRLKGDLDAALQDYCEAIRLDAHYLDPYRNRAATWQLKGDLDAALKDFTEAIRIDPHFGETYLQRATVWWLKGDPDAAFKDLAEAIRLNPKHALALNARAWWSATAHDEHYRDGQRAVADATQACTLSDWKVGIYLGTLAAAYAETGNFEKAIEYQGRAQELYDNDQAKTDGQARLALYRQAKPYREVPKVK